MQRRLQPAGVRLDLDQVMSFVTQDRWVLGALRDGAPRDGDRDGALRDGRLRVLADSAAEPDRPLRVRTLSRLARRCLHDRRPLTVSTLSVTAAAATVAPTQEPTADWEIDWPALLYVPVGVPGRRPVGLLTVGCRSQHWYTQAEIDYLGGVGMALTASVLWLDGPLARLAPDERAAARLLGQGLSVEELAAALELDRSEALELIGGVLRKLSLRSPRELASRWPELARLP
jgi:DNA-binding CsgD family transcriptional regulator